MTAEDAAFQDLQTRGARAAASLLIMPALDVRPGEQAAFAEAMALMSEDPYVGFVIFGGERGQVRRMTRSLRRIAADRSYSAPWFSADVERGLGQIVLGGSIGPALEALGLADDGEERARALGAAIAREGLAVGIDWPFIPVLDLADTSGNPIIGSRAFHHDPERVAALGAAYIQGVMETGALACGKHYPGHGGSLGDSHDSLPAVDHTAERLRKRDLLPFRRAIEAGVDALMTAHVCYPKLGDARLPATLDPALIRDLLRGELGFEGLVVTDAFIMDGLLQACGGDEAEAAVVAIDAGCDIILMPKGVRKVRDAIAAAIEDRGWAWVEDSLRRILKRKLSPAPLGGDSDALLASSQAAMEAAIAAAASQPETTIGREDDAFLVVVDDDDGEAPGLFFIAEFRDRVASLRVRSIHSKTKPELLTAIMEEASQASGALVVLVRCSVRAWKGRSEVHPDLQAFMAKLLEAAGDRPCVLVGLCGRTALQTEIADRTVFVYGDGLVCERSAARLICGERLRS